MNERVQAAAESITYFAEGGTISARGGYDAAVQRLCTLEDQREPEERYTFHLTGTGTACPRRGIELVLSRLFDYEHGRKEQCR